MDERSCEEASTACDPETLRDAMTGFLAANGVSAGSGAGARSWYPGRGLLRIRLPNFEWRKRAIACHDAHHLLTGYPCTPAGEMQMAAWEFEAGRFPHAGATAFCLPLVGLGAVLLPRRTFRAFLRGRRSSTLYATTLTDELLASRVNDLRKQFAPVELKQVTWRDGLAYLRLVGLSFALMLTPVAPMLLALWLVAGFG